MKPHPLAFASHNAYAVAVANKNATEFGDSICTRRTNRAKRFFYVCRIVAYPLWTAAVGIPSGMSVALYADSPISPLAVHPFGDGNSLTTVQGGSHATQTHV